VIKSILLSSLLLTSYLIFQREYTSRHPKGELPVKINDVLFSFHAIAMNCILIGQCLCYERAEQKISLSMGTLVCGLWASIFGVLFFTIAEKVAWLQYLYFLSYIKVGTTPIKYTPQVRCNNVAKFTS
jgi:cystinosin